MKDCKIYVNGKSEAIQKKLFEMGCKWIDGNVSVLKTSSPFLYVKNDIISEGSSMDVFSNKKLLQPEISAEEILNMKPEHQFKPFDKVLVRDGDNESWFADFYSHNDHEESFMFICVGSSYNQCIPFEGNEHLLGTTNPA